MVFVGVAVHCIQSCGLGQLHPEGRLTATILCCTTCSRPTIFGLLHLSGHPPLNHSATVAHLGNPNLESGKKDDGQPALPGGKGVLASRMLGKPHELST